MYSMSLNQDLLCDSIEIIELRVGYIIITIGTMAGADFILWFIGWENYAIYDWIL